MLFASLVGLLLQVVLAPPDVQERVKYYQVTGSSALDLRESINRLRPKDDNGEGFDGFTRWKVRWRYRYELGDDGCAASAVATFVDIETTLPKWSSRTAGAALAKQWNDYAQALRDHERGHADIAVRAAEAIQQQVSALPPTSTCLALEESIERRAAQLLERYRDEEAGYDTRTRHGATQGALFP